MVGLSPGGCCVVLLAVRFFQITIIIPWLDLGVRRSMSMGCIL